jgi:glycosyltransferase involved in cell wall biosynthesis
MTQKRILFIEAYYREFAGGQQSLFYLMKTIDRCKYEPRLLLPGDGPLNKKCKSHEIVADILPLPERLDVFGGKLLRCNFYEKFLTIKDLLKAGINYYRYLKIIKPDIICANNIRAFLYIIIPAKIIGIPCVWYLRINTKTKHQKIGLLLSKKIIMISSKLVYVFNKKERRWFKNKFFIIRNGVDIEKYVPAKRKSVRINCGFGDKEIVIGIVGKICYRKGHDIFIEVAKMIVKRFPNTKFIIVGNPYDGEEKFFQKIQNKIIEYGLQKKVFNFGWRDDIKILLGGMDIVFIPSREEGALPRVGMEALANKVPIIISKMNVVEDNIFEGQAGLMFDIRSSKDAFNQCSLLIQNSQIRGKMGEFGRDYIIKNLTIQQTAKRFIQLINTLA